MQKSVRRTKRRLTAERNKDKLGNLGIKQLRRSAGLLHQLFGLKTKFLADRSFDWIRASQAKITSNVMSSDSRQLLQAAAGAFLSANKKRPDFVSLRGRSAAVAIFKPKVWHPAAKHGSGNDKNPGDHPEFRPSVPADGRRNPPVRNKKSKKFKFSLAIP